MKVCYLIKGNLRGILRGFDIILIFSRLSSFLFI